MTYTPNGADIASRVRDSNGAVTPAQASVMLIREHALNLAPPPPSNAAKVAAALSALGAFWNSLAPSQQHPLLVQKSTIKDTIGTDTHATVLLIQRMAAAVTDLSAEQTTLKTTALAACAALVA